LSSRGINLGGVLDRRDGRLGWEVRSQHLDAIAAAGFTTVRLPVRWWGAEVPLEAHARRIAHACWARGLAVMLTMHHADAVYRDPAGAAEPLAALWHDLAARYRDAPGPLAFELLNEPRTPMTPADWNALLPRLLQAVREIDPARPVVVGGAEMSTIAGLRALELPDDDQLIATIHYYEPFRFTHQGASWEEGSEAWLGTRWGTADDRAAVTADLEEAAAWANGPLLVGEFGTLETADHASRVAWTGWVRRELERLELPWAYWDFATDFGAYDLARGAWRAPLLEALTA
jgi:endoglucanase